MRRKWKQVMAVLFLFVPLGSVKVRAQDAQPSQPSVHEIPMTCKKYDYSPDPVQVKKGERVRLVITCTDHDHGIKLEAFHVEEKLKKDVPTPVEFTADKAGTFTFQCSVRCGIGHRGMKGKLIVEE